MKRLRSVRLSGAVVLVLVLTSVSAGVAAAGGGGSLANARAATAKFHNVDVAKAAGYGLFVDKNGIACIANLPLGTMGIHYVSGYVADAIVDATKPEAVVYEPQRDGRLKLVALEYIVFQGVWEEAHGIGAAPPSLFGEDFHFVPDGNRYGIPAFYELHAWIWKPNPSGMFFEWNPRVSCNGAG